MPRRRQYPFKDGDRFESVAFEQLSSYGPVYAKVRAARRGRGSDEGAVAAGPIHAKAPRDARRPLARAVSIAAAGR